MTLWDFVGILMHHPWLVQLLENSAEKHQGNLSFLPPVNGEIDVEKPQPNVLSGKLT